MSLLVSAPVLQLKIIIGGRVVRGDLTLADQAVKNNSTLLVVKVTNMIWEQQQMQFFSAIFFLNLYTCFFLSFDRTSIMKTILSLLWDTF